MDWWRFVLWNMAGAVARAATVALVAYYLWAAAVATMGLFGLVGAAGVIAGAATVFAIVHRARLRENRRAGTSSATRRTWSRRGDAPAPFGQRVREALTSRPVAAVDLGARRST